MGQSVNDGGVVDVLGKTDGDDIIELGLGLVPSISGYLPGLNAASRKRSRSNIARSISPSATSSWKLSTAFTVKVRRRPTVEEASALTSTLPPTGVGRRCSIRTAVPTVVWPAPTSCVAD